MNAVSQDSHQSEDIKLYICESNRFFMIALKSKICKTISVKTYWSMNRTEEY